MRLTRSDRLRASLGQRGAAFALALAIELVIALLLLLFLTPILPDKKRTIPTIFGFDVPAGETQQPERSTEKATAARARTTRPRPAPPKAPETPPPPVPQPEPLPLPFIKMTRRDFAAADIRTRGTTPGATTAADAAGETASAGSPGDSAVVGKGPHGEPLYAAEWFRRPRSAEFQPYISDRARGPGWGLIACRTIADHRVEDCQELGEGPRGSGYAGAVRQAAWQFRVRAPRVGGREMVGTWVSIRITYGKADAEDGGG